MRPRSLSNVLVTLATAGSIVVASPAQHRHHHAHVQERAIKTVEVPGPTVIAYDLNGKLLDQSEVCEGIKAGTLQWKDGNVNSRECSTQTTSVEPTSSATAAVPYITPTTLATQPIRSAISQVLSASPTTTSLRETLNDFVKEAVHVSPSRTLALTTGSSLAAESPIEVSSSTSKSTSSSAKAAPSASESSTFTPSSTTGGQGLDQEFPDGEIDCTTFPSEYGPIEVEWANLGGWSGIQYVTIEGSTVTHIDTAVPGGHGCKPGAMCSYACPPGYQKSQWPSVQGATGQSVGGLSCNSDGKLALTNPGLSKNLCIQGTGAVTVQNKMSNNAAICRTDYPGMPLTFSSTSPVDIALQGPKTRLCLSTANPTAQVRSHALTLAPTSDGRETQRQLSTMSTIKELHFKTLASGPLTVLIWAIGLHLTLA